MAEPYRAAVAKVAATGCRNIGLVLGMDDWEYPLWVLLGASEDGRVRLAHFVPAGHAGTAAGSPDYCAVIVTDGADIDPGARPALRNFYQTESNHGPVTVFTAPKNVEAGLQARPGGV